MNEKRGQLKLSFGMIFSIILIIAFLGFAFFGIQKFMGYQKSIQEKQFFSNLKQDVNQVWQSTQASNRFNLTVPRDVTQVCFTPDPTENVYFYTDKATPGDYVDHLNISSETCINVEKQRASILLEKNYGDSRVTVSK